MHWITRICKNSHLANHKRLYGVSRYEDRKLFHRTSCAFKRASSDTTGHFSHQDKRAYNSGPASVSKSAAEVDPDGESIVITGISGRFPNTDSMAELKHNLYNRIDMVTPVDRWPIAYPIMPKRMGALKNMDKFDAEFFGIKDMVAETMDPQQRRLIEVAFEALVDAGCSPTKMRGTKTGVYVGTVGGEASEYWLARGDYDEYGGYKVLGIPNFIQANRLSFTLDFKGPSLAISTGCSSSFAALDTAIHSIQAGDCDQAIVAGTTIHTNPFSSAELAHLDALAHDGYCRAFDNEASGFVRSEAVIAILIQKKRDAKRHYATIRGIKSSADGFKREGLTFPSGLTQEALLRATYANSGVDPGQVVFFEAHGTGTPAGDPQELYGISKVMCKAESRTQPLLVGSVKSNMGHPESAAGLCSFAKVLLAIEQGVIAPNLYFNTPNEYAKDCFDGSLQIVTDPTPWNGGLVGVSSYGLGGSNVHVILETGPKSIPKNAEAQRAVEEKQLPILIPFSGRSKEKVQESLTEASQIAHNVEAASLLHEVFSANIPGHEYRGYAIMMPRAEEEEEAIINIEKYDGSETRPIWFIFPGMGSQWNEMGKDLMRLDAYAESMQRSQETMLNAGLDLQYLLRPNNPSIFENIRDSLVAITAVQIALLDTFSSMGIKPDGFLGHSSGEILCAYADGCLSGTEALLVGDARGRAFQESMTAPGGMASVGLTWEKAKARCPPGIFAACHNATENVTVSGPLEDIKKFAAQLQSEGIFARQVNSCNCAPHSKYVLAAGDLLFKYMNEIYQDERPRSSRWISSSIPEKRWGSPLAQTSTPAYHVNNMANPVLFHEAVQHVPSNAVVIEIAPRGLFQPILRESLPANCTLIAPMHHAVEDKVHFFLSSVGKMYNAGVDVNIGKLYPEISFPVSSSTPMLSSLVKWNHERSWTLPYLPNPTTIMGAGYYIDIDEFKHSYLTGHKLDSRCVFPATGYIVQAWVSFANVCASHYTEFPIVFKDISLERATFLKEGKPAQLRYSQMKGTDKFAMVEDDVPAMKGSVTALDNFEAHTFNLARVEIPKNPTEKSLNSEDVYKEFRLRGYNYTGEFRGIHNIDNKGRWAQVAWRGNWTSFLDTILQTTVLSVMSRTTAIPIRIESVIIDPHKFYEYVNSKEAVPIEGGQHNEVLIPVSVYPELGTVQCPGIEMRGLTAMVIPRQKQKQLLSVEDYIFTPYLDSRASKSTASAYSNVAELIDLIIENTATTKLKVVDMFASAENSLTQTIANIVDLKPKHKADITVLATTAEIEKLDESVTKLATAVTGRDSVDKLVLDSGFVDLVFLDQPSMLSYVADTLQDNAHIVLRSSAPIEGGQLPSRLDVISEKISKDATFSLFKKLPATVTPPQVQFSVHITSENFNWLANLQSAMALACSEQASPNSRLYLYSQNDPHSGIVGMAKCLRLEPGGDKIRCIFDPQNSLKIDFKSPSAELKKIIEKDLVMNVIQNGQLGSSRHIPMSQDAAAPSKKVQHAYVNTLTTGDLTSLRWVESPLAYYDPIRDKARGEVCTVHYAALNFRDIMLATGKLPVDSKTAFNPQDCVFGFEFSGVDEQKRRIMGVMGSKAMASSVLLTPECMTWEIPKAWTMEEAATIPVVYATAYYALFNRARLHLNPGQSILIHSGTGGVGQAALNIALDLKCEVFTTVGTPDKKEYIKKLFPALKDSNIGHSRDCSFEQQILELTNGRGVDIILNSLADDKLQASIRCLAVHGKFLEIGAFDAFQNSNLGMKCFLKNTSFEGIFLNHFLSGSQLEKDELGRHFEEGIQKGVVKPLARTVFEKTQIEEAFRFMAGGKHMGKVLIEVLKEEKMGEKPELMAVPRSYFSPDKSYVIVGGLGGMGLELANWLVDRGARHLILTSRSGVVTGYQQLCLRKWAEKGVKVDTPKIDLSSYELAETFMKEFNSNGKQIGGIFNSGLVLKDAPIEEQSQEDFKAVAEPKTDVTKNLDLLSRKYCKELDYFVVFSSMACGRGNASQSNYGLANSVMEQICATRKADGHHGLAIQWGVIGEVGAVAEKIFGAKLTGEEIFDGTLAQRISSCLDVLDMTLHMNASTVSSMVLADDDGNKSKKAGLLATIARICGVKDMSSILPTTKLVDLGMDSLIGMEIKQLIERDYDTPLTASEIRTMTFSDLFMIEAGTYSKKTGAGPEGASSEAFDVAAMMKGGKETMIKLKTASSGDADANVPKVFVLPGIEGHSILLQHLAAKLTSEAYGFHYNTLSEEGEEQSSVQIIARNYIKELKSVQPTGPYSLIAYSACSTIGFEMALILENEFGDKVDNVIILDGTACWSDLEGMDDAGTYIRSATKVITSAFGISAADEKVLEDELLKDSHNVQAIVDALKISSAIIDTTIVFTYFQKARALVDLVHAYKPNLKLNGKVTLIKSKEKVHYMTKMGDEKHYLERYCKEPVTAHTVDGNHMSFLQPTHVTETADIVNKILHNT